jgi:putative membrane protein
MDYFLTNFCFLGEAAATCPAKPEVSLIAFLIGGLTLGALNFSVKPLLKLLSMPITFLTAGLFVFVVNGFVLALLVWLINTMKLESASILVTGGFLTYLYGAIILGLFNLCTHWLIKRN